MALEIEHKYLVKNSEWKSLPNNRIYIKQGYLNLNPERTVRVRVTEDKAYLTIKGKTSGITRTEFEYPIPITEATNLLKLCEGAIIEKIRYEIIIDKKTWEIDVFKGDNQGLIIAEIELTSENDTFTKPHWIGKEVSDQAKYYNASLVTKPFSTW